MTWTEAGKRVRDRRTAKPPRSKNPRVDDCANALREGPPKGQLRTRSGSLYTMTSHSDAHDWPGLFQPLGPV